MSPVQPSSSSVNREAWDGLEPDLQAVVENAAAATNVRMLAEFTAANVESQTRVDRGAWRPDTPVPGGGSSGRCCATAMTSCEPRRGKTTWRAASSRAGSVSGTTRVPATRTRNRATCSSGADQEPVRRRRFDRVREPFRVPGRRACWWQTLNGRRDRHQSPGPDDVGRARTSGSGTMLIAAPRSLGIDDPGPGGWAVWQHVPDTVTFS